MNECFSRQFIINGELKPSRLFSDVMVYEGESVYEVLRLADGLPVFFNDHLERLTLSVKMQGRQMLADRNMLRSAIIRLASNERTITANLKIVFNFRERSSDYLVYFTKPVYPTEDQYLKGVRGIFYYAEREEPVAKVLNLGLRNNIKVALSETEAYEAVLVDRHGFITEGSRSNIFFIGNDVLFTSHSERVLNGITRKYLLEICREKGIRTEFRDIAVSGARTYQSAFLTGTSPVVLPFSSIGEYVYNVRNPLILFLRNQLLEKAVGSLKYF